MYLNCEEARFGEMGMRRWGNEEMRNQLLHKWIEDKFKCLLAYIRAFVAEFCLSPVFATVGELTTRANKLRV